MACKWRSPRQFGLEASGRARIERSGPSADAEGGSVSVPATPGPLAVGSRLTLVGSAWAPRLGDFQGFATSALSVTAYCERKGLARYFDVACTQACWRGTGRAADGARLLRRVPPGGWVCLVTSAPFARLSAHGAGDPLISPHPEYLRLGLGPAARELVYRMLFDEVTTPERGAEILACAWFGTLPATGGGHVRALRESQIRAAACREEGALTHSQHQKDARARP